MTGAPISIAAEVQSAAHKLKLCDMRTELAKDCAAAFARMPPWSSHHINEGALREYFSEIEPGAPRYAVCLASEPTVVIGVLGLRLNWLKGPYVQFLGLKTDFQSAGIGRALLSHVELSARDSKANSLWVMVSDSNKRARDFYERFGFYKVGAVDHLVSEGQSEWLMRKRLT